MITFYSGTPGSGKSYHVARDIYDMVRRGVNVIANFDVNTDVIKSRRKGSFYHVYNCDLTVDYLINFALDNHIRRNDRIVEGQTYLIIDECQMIFNSRDFNRKDRLSWIDFFTQHRKYGYEIILISQFDRLIDRQIRSLIEYEYKHRKVNNFGNFGFLLGLFFLNKPIFAVIGTWYGVREKISTQFLVGFNRYYRLYDSYKIFDKGV